MATVRRQSAVVIIFTIILIAVVNLAWWLMYQKTEKSYEAQLSRRLTAVAALGADQLRPDLIQSLGDGSLAAYDTVLQVLDEIQRVDSLSEVFILGPDYNYLATTQLTGDSVYYLQALNGEYIDSVLLGGTSGSPVVSRSHKVGDIFLKTAFAPLNDTSGFTPAVLGLEADLDYTDNLNQLKNNLIFSSGLSIGAGLLFGILFFVVQRRLANAERSLLRSQAQANLGRMVAVVSHELKNPLMIIRAAAERLKKGRESSAEMPETGFILEEVDRLNEIVTGYLDFASGRKPLVKQIIDLTEVIKRLADQFGPGFKKDGISLNLDIDDNKNEIEVDPIAVRQIVINLLLNAADASKKATNPEIMVSITEESGRNVIAVRDNGPGIEPDKTKTLFEPFYTTSPTGSGLGLYLSKKLADDMGGSINFDSRPGGPTTFRLTLDKPRS